MRAGESAEIMGFVDEVADVGAYSSAEKELYV